MPLPIVDALLPLFLTISPVSTAPQSDAAATGVSERGIWIGNLNLCQSGPPTAEATVDAYDGLPIVRITLPATLRQPLAELTAAHIGKPLAIRVDGRVVSEPHVNEPITGGQIQIAGVDRAEADRIAAAFQGCAAGTAKTGA